MSTLAPENRSLAQPALASLAWVVAKLACLYWFVFRPNEYSDTYYYFLQCQSSGGDVARMSPEYPTPAALLLLVPWWLGARDYDAYRLGFLAVLLAFDIAFVILLVWRRQTAAILAWGLLEFASGRLALLRFDVIPATSAASTVLLLTTRRFAAGAAMTALGTAIKLWPVILAPLMWHDKDRRKQVIGGFGLTAAVLVAGSLLVGGPQRLLSPLTFQNKRGLQVESVWASVPVLQHLVDPQVQMFYAPSNSWEVSGPGVDAWTYAATVSTAVAIVGLAWLWWRWMSKADLSMVAPFGVLIVTAVVTTSKVLSPQYLLWIAPLVVVWMTSTRRRSGVLAFVWVLALFACTYLVYPTRYDDLTWHKDATAAMLLVARNVALVGFAGWLGWFCWRETKPYNPRFLA